MNQLEIKTEFEIFNWVDFGTKHKPKKKWVSVESLKQLIWSSKLTVEEKLNKLQNQLEEKE